MEPGGSLHFSIKAKDVPLYAMKTLGGKEVYSSYSFLTSALDGVSGQRYSPTALYSLGKDPRPLDRWLGGPQIDLDTEARGKILLRLPGIEPLPPGRSARSQTL
jgi:hypothetical protein